MKFQTTRARGIGRADGRSLLFCALLVLAQPALCADPLEDTGPSVTPYRPSVSTPANLSAPGYLELEFGGLRVRGEGSTRRDSLPYTAKLAFDENWGLRISGDAWVRQRDSSGERLEGTGDTGIVLKRRFAVDDKSAFGLELGATMPTGKTGIGADSAAYSLNGIYSVDIGEWHSDLNLMTTRTNDPGQGISRFQTLWAASLSRPLSDRVGITGEFSGTNQRGAAGTSHFLLAATYNVSKALVLDAGAARSLRRGAPDTSFFMGLTLLGPRLF